MILLHLQLKNAFDCLFEDLMEVKNGEIEAADVSVCNRVCILVASTLALKRKQ